MSSNARNARSRPLRGDRNLIDRGLLTRGWSQRGGREKLSVDQTAQGCVAQLGYQGEGWWPYYPRLHFLRARQCW